jgi:DNA-binding transcriptional MerR regulator
MTSERAPSGPRFHVVHGQREYSIKEVLTLLQPEFPDITISKIRFLESKGLIAPERNAAGYRRFYQHDIDRLAEILRLQRSTYMPLKKIKEHLEGDRPIDLFPGGTEPELPSRRSDLVSIDDLAAQLEVSVASIEEIVAGGFATGVMVAGKRHFGPLEAEIVRVVHAFGSLGFEPRHLRQFRNWANWELGALEARIAPLVRQRSPEARRRAIAQLDEMLELGGELRRLLLALGTAELRRSAGQSS